MGLEAPRPGSLAFQRRFLSSLHCVGRFVPLPRPRPPGPRNCGQSSAIKQVAVARRKKGSNKNLAMKSSLRPKEGGDESRTDTTACNCLKGILCSGKQEVLDSANAVNEFP